MAELGFALSISDIGELVESFVLHNRMENAKARLKYRGRKGHPGPDWVKLFMNRHKLSLKEATKLCVARYSATKNPFIVYHFYDILGQVIKDLGIENRRKLFWNCDEFGLPHKPKKCKSFLKKDKIQYRSVKELMSLLLCTSVYIFLYFLFPSTFKNEK